MNLYELAAQYRFLQSMQEDEEGNPLSLEQQLETIEGTFEVKALSVVRAIKNMTAEVDAIDIEIRRLTERKKAATNQVAKYKTYLEEGLALSGLRTVGDDIFTVTRQKSPMSLTILDEAKVPDDYAVETTVRTVDKRAILQLIKLTGEIPEWADVCENYHVVIR